ncbi:MAG TPA: methyltransferase domain-containing protein [Ktedonobacterales bacterium]
MADANERQDELAAALLERLVDNLVSSGTLRDTAVERAMRAVPRHIFLPVTSLDRAYRDIAVPTHLEAGIAVSSASQPSMVAIMLQQLDVAPGMRVLEVGAGTGYNAALLRELVGADGTVVSIELDSAIAEEARAHLRAAGLPVEVVTGDGAGGWPASAPYDRIIVTAAAFDLSPAWVEQLAVSGKIVAPLVLNGIEASVVFARDGETLVSLSLAPCSFMRLRSSAGLVPVGASRAVSGECAQTLAPRIALLLAGRPRPHAVRRPLDDLKPWLGLAGVTPLTLWQMRQRGARRPRVALWADDASGPSLAVVSVIPQVTLVYGSEAFEHALASAEEAQRVRPLPGVQQWAIRAWPTGQRVETPAGVAIIARPSYTYAIDSSAR